ncbi:MAG: shikimate dehydrogenase [Cellvibrionales bacterium]|nr:shikimate dehydrogenase [Cellvibrionales bacterium]
MTDQYAVFGNPVEHSKSPEMHHAFARETAQDIHYSKQLVEEDQFEHAVREFQTKGGKGLNITVPFKIKAFKLADEKTERANKAQAANTLIFQADGKILADNTDGFGLVEDILTTHHWQIQDKTLLILGAGGAVQGVIAPLLAANPASIKIYNRTFSKAAAIVEHFKDARLQALESLEHRHFDLIINGTSASLTGQSLHLPSSLLRETTCCYDMMYSKTLTPFLQWAKDHHIQQLADGLGMLVNQGAEAFRLWRHITPSSQPVIAQLRAGLT